MGLTDVVRSLNERVEEVARSLPLHKKLMLKLLGFTKIGEHEGTPIYLARCPSCKKLFVDYPHGYDEVLRCPYCTQRLLREIEEEIGRLRT